jgi:hypothetical protein
VTDLANISGGMYFLSPLVESPLLLGLGSWFLYAILGKAALVGLAVMLLLLPVPAITSKLLEGVEQRKMDATDARVKEVKDMLNVIRMVKQFGWEEEVKKQIETHRVEELKWIFWGKIYNLVNIVVKYALVTSPASTLSNAYAVAPSPFYISWPHFHTLRSSRNGSCPHRSFFLP